MGYVDAFDSCNIWQMISLSGQGVASEGYRLWNEITQWPIMSKDSRITKGLLIDQITIYTIDDSGVSMILR